MLEFTIFKGLETLLLELPTQYIIREFLNDFWEELSGILFRIPDDFVGNLGGLSDLEQLSFRCLCNLFFDEKDFS